MAAHGAARSPIRDVVACGRPGCPCPHDDCDRGWLEAGAIAGCERVAPCPACRPERQATGWVTATDRARWLAAGNARLAEIPRQRRRKVPA